MKKILFYIFILVNYSMSVQAQLQSAPSGNMHTDPKIIAGFMDKRLGLFIHWGPVTLRGTEIGWSRNHQVSQSDYDSLYKEFNPVLFDADQWVKTAKDAGMKYLTITAKHHDGFCLWPTAFSTYNIMHTPYKKDIVGALAKSCKKYGIQFCIYYSVLDWHHPDYPLHNDGKKTPNPLADMEKYRVYMKNQLKELITQYHPYMLWFDGNWESPWTQDMATDLYQYLKKLDKNVIINNRLGKTSDEGMGPGTVGDYATPEQHIGQLNMKDPWESCITLCEQWAWKPNDAMKSLPQCIQTLCSTAGGNGNLLLNVGPMPDGRMEARQIKRLKEIGDWLKQYGSSIYGTKGGPFVPDSICAFTRKDNKIYVHLFHATGSQLVMPDLPGFRITKAYFLKGEAVPFYHYGDHMSLELHRNLPDPVCSVFVLEMNAPVENIPVIIKITSKID